MKIGDLKQVQDREPFRPFTIHLASGTSVPVEHPEQLHVNPKADLFTLWEGPKWNLIDIASVERISVVAKTKSAK
jgi:hypothetical protein